MSEGTRPTRYTDLGYRCDGPGLWRFIDRDGEAAIGAVYPTKAELLADVDRFYLERWGNPHAAQEAAAVLLASGQFRWCRARLLHALAGAASQGVLDEVLAELLDDDLDGLLSVTTETPAETIVRWLREELTAKGWMRAGAHVPAGEKTDG